MEHACWALLLDWNTSVYHFAFFLNMQLKNQRRFVQKLTHCPKPLYTCKTFKEAMFIRSYQVKTSLQRPVNLNHEVRPSYFHDFPTQQMKTLGTAFTFVVGKRLGNSVCALGVRSHVFAATGDVQIYVLYASA